jgi:oligosaccharyltransferase complex subunit beta
MILRTLVATLIVVTCIQAGAADNSKKVLALFESLENSSSYAQYLGRIKEQGYEIEQRSATDPKLHLREWNTWKYGKLIIFASGIKSFGGALDSEAILDFVDAGHDLILAADSRASEEVRNLASDLGVDLEARGSVVTDTLGGVAQSKAVDASLVLSTQVLDAPAVFGETPIKDPILFRGIGASIAPDSQQAFQVLGGEASHFVADPEKGFTEEVQAAGKAISLFAVSQTRNDARVVVSGSMDAFTDTFLQATNVKTKSGASYTKTGNEQFLVELTRWAFHERSVLRVSNLRHHPPNSTEQPQRYRITDEVVFEVNIEQYKDGSWQPYEASDVQLEFVMLDPHVRTFLEHDRQGRFFKQFKIPDVYGVFKFVVDYNRLGLTHLELSHQIQVRHFRHDEFERFLVAAYPYYTSAFSCMAAFLIFSVVFLYHRDK